jgi:hypothetical protein
VVIRSKAWVCDCSLAGNAGANLSGGVEVCLWLCVVRSPLCSADHSPRGVLSNVVFLCVIVKPPQ